MWDAGFTLDMATRRKSSCLLHLMADDQEDRQEPSHSHSRWLLSADHLWLQSLCSGQPWCWDTFHSFCKKGPEIEIVVGLWLCFCLDSDPVSWVDNFPSLGTVFSRSPQSSFSPPKAHLWGTRGRVHRKFRLWVAFLWDPDFLRSDSCHPGNVPF